MQTLLLVHGTGLSCRHVLRQFLRFIGGSNLMAAHHTDKLYLFRGFRLVQPLFAFQSDLRVAGNSVHDPFAAKEILKAPCQPFGLVRAHPQIGISPVGVYEEFLPLQSEDIGFLLYRLSSPSYIVPIGMMTAMTSAPIRTAIKMMIMGSMAASTLWVAISTSSS